MIGKKILGWIHDPKRIIYILSSKGLLRWVSDEQYIKMVYRIAFKRTLNLSVPNTYTEKTQWLKLMDHNELYPLLVDKYSVKEYVGNIIGTKYIIPTLGVWDKFEEIDFSTLPDQFVLKCTHDSGGLVIVQDKNNFDYSNAKRKIEQCLKKNYYWLGREWPYKSVKPRIIAEKYIADSTENGLPDYKFFCTNGEVKALFVATDRQNSQEETKFDFFDKDYNHLPVLNGHPNAITLPKKPKCFDEMKKLASLLSKDFPHLRVDFYEVDGRVLFGELTLYHWSGFVPFEPPEWDSRFSDWIDLSAVKLSSGKEIQKCRL